MGSSFANAMSQSTIRGERFTNGLDNDHHHEPDKLAQIEVPRVTARVVMQFMNEYLMLNADQFNDRSFA